MARRPIWLWPNLLSLDAPLVALAWFWMFKELWLVEYHQPTLPWLLVLAVWCVYVADRLVDERMAALGALRSTPRHEFHRRWRRPLTVGLLVGIIAALGLLYLQPRGLYLEYPRSGLLVLVPVGAYFLVAFHSAGRAVSYFKNLLGGMAFAYGTAVGVHLHSSGSGDLWGFLSSAEVISFGVLCMLNMTAIDHWEQARQAEDPDEGTQYEVLLTILLLLLVAFAFLLAVRADGLGLKTHKAFFIAIMAAAGALQVVNHMRARFSLDALRVLADVAMLLPLPLFYLLAGNPPT